ncbi:hypothetical protein BDY24DRAFT_381932 [Mrakia frigida]|uniref:uncharacterized protein n=1 Tax=Mrakia frigida TaxID=29902 RepID=UPI003FCC04B3
MSLGSTVSFVWGVQIETVPLLLGSSLLLLLLPLVTALSELHHLPYRLPMLRILPSSRDLLRSSLPPNPNEHPSTRAQLLLLPPPSTIPRLPPSRSHRHDP